MIDINFVFLNIQTQRHIYLENYLAHLCWKNLHYRAIQLFVYVEHNCFILKFSQAGMSRSGTVVVAYIMKNLDLSVDEALKLVRSQKPDTWYFIYICVCVCVVCFFESEQ